MLFDAKRDPGLKVRFSATLGEEPEIEAAREGLVVRGETRDQTDLESRSAGTEPHL